MIYTKVKIIKRIAIIFLIALFNVAGITACSGAGYISGSSSGFATVSEPDNGITGYTSNLGFGL